METHHVPVYARNIPATSSERPGRGIVIDTSGGSVVVTADRAVVVPAINNQSSTACIRSLGKRGIHVIGVAENRAAPAIHSKYCSEVAIAPGPETDIEAYASRLLELARRPSVRTITPHREGDIYVLSKYREEFSEHIGTPWPDFETVRRSQDRLALLEVARDVGVTVPETKLLTEWDEWDRQTIVKPRYSALVDGGRMRSATVQFPAPGERPDVDAVIEELGHEPIVQAYVPGDPGGNEHGFYALYDHGTPIAEFQHRRVRSFRYTGGASVYRKSIFDPDLQRAGRAVLDALEWHGPAMVEFKRNPQTDEFVLMEVNPRFWGSLALSIEAGIDFPYIYYQLATDGVDAGSTPTYRENVGCHLFWGELAYVLNLFTVHSEHVERPPRLRETGRVMRSLVSEPRFDLLSVDDGRPFVQETKNYVSDAVGRYRS